MRLTDEQVQAKRRERFEVMAVRLANHTGMSKADSFDHLPPSIREHLNGLRYCDIVKPLIQADHAKGASFRMMAVKYGLSKRSIQDKVK